MRVAFFGTPEFALVTLEKLIESSHEVVCVVTQPDRPKGRGRKLVPPPVKSLALAHDLPVVQPESIKKPSFVPDLAAMNVDVAVVVAYGQILPANLLAVPKYGFLNVHASLLPKYRGAAPIQWALANGERQTGITIMQITEGLDAGPIVKKTAIDILEDDDAQSLHDMLSVMGGEAMIQSLDHIQRKGTVSSTPQNDAEASYAPMIRREDARIDWDDDAEKSIWKVRAFVIWPGAHARHEGEEIKFLGADAVDPNWIRAGWQGDEIEPGTVVDIVKERGFVVKTGGDGLMLITRVKPAGKREMSAPSALNGNLVKVGMKFD